MSYIPVIDSSILSSEILVSQDNRELQILELEYPDFSYSPGQFVMIQLQEKGFQWSYPYMIYEGTPAGLKIIVSKNSSLWGIRPGNKIAIWGANGKPCLPTPGSILVAEPATIHLLAPLMVGSQNPTIFIAGSQASIPAALVPKSTFFIPDLQELSQKLSETDTPVYMALNLPVIEKILKNCRIDFKERTTVFVSTRIGCGIGACKSCYLHSPEIALGIPVCCEGPYLPCTRIDFEKDKKCFQNFR